MSYEYIILEKSGGIARLTLNRPAKMNAMSRALLREFDSAIADVRQDKALKVLVIKGAGRTFTAGYDWKDPERPTHEGMSASEVLLEMRTTGKVNMDRWLQLWELPQAVVAQVHGYCLAGGLGLAMFCDIVIAADDASFGYPIARTGVGAQHLWPWHLGPMKTKELLFTGDSISGKEAERIGMINRAVPLDKLEEEVNKLVAKIDSMPSEQINLHKIATNRTFEMMGFKNALNYVLELHAYGHATPANEGFDKDLKEKGLKAALEARDKDFKS